MTRKRFPFYRGAILAVVLAGIAGATQSCSVIIDTSSKQCSIDADCAKLGTAFAGTTCQKNVCVKQAVQDPLVCEKPDAGTPAAGDTVKFTFTVDFAAKPTNPLPFTISACSRLDVNCDTPVFGPVMANAGDLVELDVPSGFSGYIQLLNKSTVNALEFLAKPITEDTHGWDLTIATPSTVSLLGLTTSTTVDPTLGAVVVIARDCNRVALAGVSASCQASQDDLPDAAPDNTVSFYFDNMFPTKSLMATTTEGAAGFVNVPLGTVTLTGVINGDTMHTLQPTSAVSRAGWFSYVEIQP